MPATDTPAEAGELVTAAGSRTGSGTVRTPARTFPLGPGARLGVRVDPGRWCLGRRGTDGATIPCPDGARVARGRQCPRCQADDPWRWLHIVHRSQFGPDPALRAHLMRPHWLYVATFAGGMTKVGTAVDERKHDRIDEQGAVFAHWVGLAADGLEVRDWEDRVSRDAGVGQVVRPAAKAAGLAGPVDLHELERIHHAGVDRVGEALAAVPGAAPFAEPWPNPRDPATLEGGVRHPYPETLDHGAHGFTVRSWWGPVALVELDGDPDALWSVDVSALVGHRVTLGDHATPVPQIQDSLF